MTLKIRVCGRRSIQQIASICDMPFLMKKSFFRHLKLEIASAIPASNDEKSFKARNCLFQYLINLKPGIANEISSF